MIYGYKQDKNGKVERIILSEQKRPKGEEKPDDHFSQTILKAYYRQEIEKGSRFRSGYSKNAIKRVHDTALARWRELGQEH